MNRLVIAPSILAADFGRLAEEWASAGKVSWSRARSQRTSFSIVIPLKS